MYVDTLECPSTDGLMLRIGGPAPDGVNRRSLVFTPTFPCGIERGPGFAAADDAPLVRIATMKVCVGDGCDPSRMVLIRGHVQAGDSTRGVGVIDPRTFDVCEGASSAPRVKLEIQSCKWAGSVIIDSDSEIAVPSGDVSINVLAPGPNAAGLGAFVRGQTTIAAPTPWQDVTLRIGACPLDCYTPPGVLTEWIAGITDVVGSPQDRTLIRPRRARRLEMDNRDNAGAAATVQVDFFQELAAITSLGRVVFATTPVTKNMVGAAQAIQLLGVAAGVNTYITWEVR